MLCAGAVGSGSTGSAIFFASLPLTHAPNPPPTPDDDIIKEIKGTRLRRDDFETIKIIGRGAFGEVGVGRTLFPSLRAFSLFS